VVFDCDGSNLLFIGFGGDMLYWLGEGDNIVVLILNVCDVNYYVFSIFDGVMYIVGFFSFLFNEFYDCNVMMIDSYDWV